MTRSVPRTLQPLLAAVGLALIVNALVGYPGVPSVDTQFQYHEALTGRYTDWHPPVMAYLWSLVRHVADGNGPMFLLHVACYWFGIGTIAVSLATLDRRWGAWTMLILGLLPMNLSINAQFVKDAGMGDALLAAFALVFWHRARQRRVSAVAQGLVAAFLAYAVLVRVNGIFAAAALLPYLAAPRLRTMPLRLAAVGLVLVAVLLPVTGAVNHALLRAAATHPVRSLQVFDVTGIARFSGDDSVFGGAGGFTPRQVHRCYSAATWDSLSPFAKCHEFWDALGTVPGVPDTRTPDGRSWYENPPNPDLDRLWLEAITRHPLAYLKHRLRYFNEAVGFLVQRHHADRAVLDHIAYAQPMSALSAMSARDRWLDALLSNPIVTPAVAIALGLALLMRNRRRAAGPGALRELSAEREANATAGLGGTEPLAISDAVFFLSISGLTYAAGFFVVGVSSDARYQFWTLLAIGSGAVIALPVHWRDAIPRSRVAWAGVALVLSTVVVSSMAWIIRGDALPR